MKIDRYAIGFVIICMVLGFFIVVSTTPVLADGWISKYSGAVDNGSTHTYNSCFVRFDIVNGSESSVHVTFSAAPGYLIEMRTISPGNSYYYNDLIRVYVAEINTTSDKIWVDIAVPSGASDASPTPAPGGTAVSCDTPGLQALAGDVVTFPIVIQNNDNVEHTYSLSASSSTGWDFRFVNDNKGVYKLYVPSKQSRTVNLEASTSGITTVGEKKVTAMVDSRSIDLFVYITSVNRSASVSFDVSSKIGSVGDTISYSLKITNLQSKENLYLLSVSGLPANWYYRYKTSATSQDELAEVIVPAGGTQNLVLEIVPPYSVSPGDYNLTATVTAPDGAGVSNDLRIRLKSSAGMNMATSRLGYEAKPGETFEIDVYLSNTGSGTALTNLYLETDAPDGWTVQVSPDKVSSLTAGSTQTFKVKVTPPGNIVASQYAVDITAKSDQAEGQLREYTIDVTVDSYIPYIGGAIILSVLVGLVLVYRKYGRR